MTFAVLVGLLFSGALVDLLRAKHLQDPCAISDNSYGAHWSDAIYCNAIAGGPYWG